MTTTTDNLAAEYARLCATPSDIHLHLPRFVAMVEEMDAQRVLELGTRTGVSTVAWLHGLASTGGHLTSVDIDERPPIGEHDRWEFIQGDDTDPAIVARLGEHAYDIVFIDTSHLYEHTLSELYLYRWLVRPGGLIVLHDTELPRPEGAPLRPAYPVKTAVTEFCDAEGYEWINIAECWGLGVIRL